MPSQLPLSEGKIHPLILPLRGDHELTRILAFTTASAEAPAWPASAWRSFLAENAPADEPQRLMLGAIEADASLVGLVAVTSYEQTVELELLLVHPAMRRQGIGRALSRAWLQWAVQEKAREAVLEVRESNRAAQTLYSQLGFAVDGRRSNYYSGPSEDALLMTRHFPEDTSRDTSIQRT